MEHKIYENEEIRNMYTALGVTVGTPEDPKALNLVNYAAEPVRVQVQVRGSYSAIRYEAPGQECFQSLVPVKHDGFTEFVIPDLMIAGRVYLEAEQAANAKAGQRTH